MSIDRRQFLELAGIGGVAFASGLAAASTDAASGGRSDFYFVQLSDTHWGFEGPALNPDAGGTLQKAVIAVNRLGRIQVAGWADRSSKTLLHPGRTRCSGR